jgi:hypothetical protein
LPNINIPSGTHENERDRALAHGRQVVVALGGAESDISQILPIGIELINIKGSKKIIFVLKFCYFVILYNFFYNDQS